MWLLCRVAQCHHARSARYRLSQNPQTVARCAVFSEFVNRNCDSLKPERAQKQLALFFAHDNKQLIRKIKRADYGSEAFKWNARVQEVKLYMNFCSKYHRLRMRTHMYYHKCVSRCSLSRLSERKGAQWWLDSGRSRGERGKEANRDKTTTKKNY